MSRVGTADLDTLQTHHFESFFKLGLPKVLSSLLFEQDWCVDPQNGIRVFEFARPRAQGEYRMLHLVMDVNRQAPPREQRSPNSSPAGAVKAYGDVARKIFEDSEVVVTDELANTVELKPSLDQIRARRRKYYREEV